MPSLPRPLLAFWTQRWAQWTKAPFSLSCFWQPSRQSGVEARLTSETLVLCRAVSLVFWLLTLHF